MGLRGILASMVLLFGSAAAQGAGVDFNLPTLDGGNLRLADYRGKWVVVNFWATWCPPCLDELPELVRFHDEHKDRDAVVLGVNFEDIDLQRLREFVEDYFISYPVLRHTPGYTTPLGPISGLPTTYVVDPDGNIAARHVGPLTASMLEDFIASENRLRAAADRAR